MALLAGITDVFSQDADLSRIDGTKHLYVSNVVHQAFVEVRHEGFFFFFFFYILRIHVCLSRARDGKKTKILDRSCHGLETISIKGAQEI